MKTVQELIDLGDKYYLDQKYAEAREAYQQALAQDPDSAYVLTMIGDSFRMSHQFTEAIPWFERSVEKGPGNSDTYNRWGLALSGLEDYDAAIEKFEKALEFDPDYFYAYYNWGNTLVSQGRREEAVKKYRKTLEIRPDYGNGLYRLGLTLAELKKHKEAIAQYRQLLEYDPDNSNACNAWGNVLFEMEKYAQAIEKYQRAVELDPGNKYAQRNIGLALTRLDRTDEAVESYRKALEIDPQYADALNEWGNALYERDAYDGAIEKYSLAIAADPDHKYAYQNLGNALNAKKEYSEAIKYLNIAIQLDPGYAEAYNALGNSYYQSGQYDEALVQYLQAIETKTNYKIAHRNLGNTYRALRRYEEAVEQFQQALSIDPAYTDVYNDWGNVLFDQKKYEEAVEQYHKALEVDPTYRHAYRNKGNALRNLKRFDEAIVAYQKALELNPEDADVLNEIGNSYYDQKEYQLAVEHYHRAVTIDPSHFHAQRNWGLVLTEQKLYEEAAKKFIRATELSPEYAFAWHNLAFNYLRRGNYSLALENWKNALKAYQANEATALREANADHFYYVGNIHISVFRDYEQAIRAYERGLKLDPRHTGILAGLVDLYLSQKEDLEYQSADNYEKVNVTHWKAREAFQKARAVLDELLKEKEDLDLVAQIGELHLAVGEYAEAEKAFNKALGLDDSQAYLYADLGVIKMRKEDYRGAIEHFKAAVARDQDDFGNISNLAEAYLKANQLDQAEFEYRKVLRIAPAHIDSLIGLGEVYTAMGDSPREGTRSLDAEEMYYQAIQQYSRALKVADTDAASKKLKPGEVAAIYYSRGYARVMLHDTQAYKDDALLVRARADFQKIPEVDRNFHKARRNIAKISERLNPFSSQSLEQRVGPMAFFILSLIIFIAWQVFFFVGKPTLAGKNFVLSEQTFAVLTSQNVPEQALKALEAIGNQEFAAETDLVSAVQAALGEDQFTQFGDLVIDATEQSGPTWQFESIEPGYYALVTFGSMIFMIAGLYLQQISRLKFAGIEIEKSSVDQISKSTSLGISR